MQSLKHKYHFSIKEQNRETAFQEQLNKFKKQVEYQQEDQRRRFEDGRRARRKEFEENEKARDERESRAMRIRQEELEEVQEIKRKQPWDFQNRSSWLRLSTLKLKRKLNLRHGLII